MGASAPIRRFYRYIAACSCRPCATYPLESFHLVLRILRLRQSHTPVLRKWPTKLPGASAKRDRCSPYTDRAARPRPRDSFVRFKPTGGSGSFVASPGPCLAAPDKHPQLIAARPGTREPSRSAVDRGGFQSRRWALGQGLANRRGIRRGQKRQGAWKSVQAPRLLNSLIKAVSISVGPYTPSAVGSLPISPGPPPSLPAGMESKPQPKPASGDHSHGKALSVGSASDPARILNFSFRS